MRGIIEGEVWSHLDPVEEPLPWRYRIVVLLTLLVLSSLLSSHAAAGEHRLYVGLGWVHLSNLDAGKPFNDLDEDSADHVGVQTEYQYVLKSGNYFYTVVGMGQTQLKRAEGEDRWECSGCKVNSYLSVGFNWRVW